MLGRIQARVARQRVTRAQETATAAASKRFPRAFRYDSRDLAPRGVTIDSVRSAVSAVPQGLGSVEVPGFRYLALMLHHWDQLTDHQSTLADLVKNQDTVPFDDMRAAITRMAVDTPRGDLTDEGYNAAVIAAVEREPQIREVTRMWREARHAVEHARAGFTAADNTWRELQWPIEAERIQNSPRSPFTRWKRSFVAWRKSNRGRQQAEAAGREAFYADYNDRM